MLSFFHADTIASVCSQVDGDAEQIAAAGAVAFGDEVGLTVYPLGWLSGATVLALVHILAFIHPFLSLLILVTYNISFAPLIVKGRCVLRADWRCLSCWL